MGLSCGASGADVAVVGMGNPYCTDDGVGVSVVRSLPPRENVEVWETVQGGAYLAQTLLGYSRVLLVDAAPSLPPGEVRLQPLSAWEALGGERRGAHGLSLTQALEMLRALSGGDTSDAGCDVALGDQRRTQGATLHQPERSVGACLRRGEASQTSCDATDVGLKVPEVWALAIGVPPDPPFGEGLSPRVAAAVPAAVEEVRGWLTR